MSEAVDQHELTLPAFETRPVGGLLLHADRQFNIALVVATVAHLLFLVSFISAESRHLGDPGGARDGISVDFVSEADLKSMGTVADRAAGPLAPPTPPPEPPQQQKPAPQPEPPPPEPRAPEPQAQPKAEPPPQQTAALTAEPPPPSAPQEQAKAASPDKPAMLPDPAVEQLLKIPTQAALPHTLDPPKPPEPAKPATPAKPEQARRAQPKQSQVRTSSLDLSLPPSFYAAPFGGGGVGVHRPAGVTRSGENDTFSRGVIAALQRSMPQLRETLGRVTVRIILDKDGSLVKTEVIRPSSVAGLDQSVVFSTRQASFPFPPRNANSADLTFLVTYIYR